MSDIIKLAIELAVAAGLLGGAGIGLATAARALWRWAGNVGHANDMQRLEMQTASDLARTQMAIEQASVDRAIALQPRSITYSPHTTYQRGSLLPLDQADTAPNIEAQPRPTPTFAELLREGKVGRGSALLLGVGETGDIPGTWTDLYSTALAGLPGSGKTTTQRFFACQTAMHGARFVVADPHFGTSEDSLGTTLAPLKHCFLCDVADNESKILEAVKLVDDEGKRRLKSGDRTPIILWIDEVTALLNSKIGPVLAALMEEIARQYRKVGVHLSASGQIWLVSRSGGSSALRDSLASVVAHRMKRNQARLLLPSEDAQKCERLETGQAILYRTSGHSERISIPLTTANDVRTVAGLLLSNTAATMPNLVSRGTTRETPATPPAEGRPKPASAETPAEEPETASNDVAEVASGKHIGSAWEVSETSTQTNTTHDPETSRILAAFASGKAIREIAIELCGVGSGRAYQQASTRVQEALRSALAG